ncbi:MAG: 50S ribosomal protein L25/general stress protein Ctc [Rhodocyclaceae bacterium]|nr:50S ribosomal protein L25/general stress protein Ctc [Rhodocyclaceae bacterium]
MQIEFNATQRATQGTSASRRLRHAGRIPGILYGGSDQPQNVEIDHNEIFQLLRKEAFYSSVLTMNLAGTPQMCLLRDVQRHPFRQLILHVDFQRIDASHEIHQKIPLHFINADIAPGVKLDGGMVQHVMNDIEVKCLPANLPSFIEVDLKDLTAAISLHVSQLKLPEGVTVQLHKGEDPVVATILVRGGSAAAADEAADAAPVVAPEKKAPVKKSEKTDRR